MNILNRARSEARQKAIEGAHAYLRRRGWQLSRYPSSHNMAHKRGLILRHLRTTMVLDIGANTGQYGAEIRRYGYAGNIVSYEPLPDAFASLSKRCAKDPQWTVHNLAVGSRDGEIQLHVAGNSVSSSALQMLDRHLRAAPTSAFVGSVSVPSVRLDSVGTWTGNVPEIEKQRLYLKIDTQGFEREVLDGSADTLQQVAAVEIELSLTPLYEGQALHTELTSRLGNAGFRLAGIHPGFWDPHNGETLQVDGIFIKT